MWLKLLVTAFIIAGAAAAADAKPRWQSCLPADVEADEVISVEPSLHGRPARELKVATKLNSLGARCRGRQLVDSRRKPIRFFRMAGCWGNPPADYQEIIANQTRELARLRRRYRVIEISCNPSGRMAQ